MFNLFDPDMFVLRLVDLEFDVVNSTADGFKVSSVDVMVDVVVVEIKTDVAEVVEVVFINSNVIVVDGPTYKNIEKLALEPFIEHMGASVYKSKGFMPWRTGWVGSGTL